MGQIRKSVETGLDALREGGIGIRDIRIMAMMNRIPRNILLLSPEIDFHPSDEYVLKLRVEVLALQHEKTKQVSDLAYLPTMPENYQLLMEVFKLNIT